MHIIRIKIKMKIVKTTILFNKTSQLFQFLNIGVKAKEKNKKSLFCSTDSDGFADNI